MREISLRFAIGDAIRDRRKVFAPIASGVLSPDDLIGERTCEPLTFGVEVC